MNPVIIQLYEQWFDKTGNENAAATLVLAEVQARESVERGGFDKSMLKPREVAKQLSVSPATVIGWIRGGNLKGSNLARPGKKPRWVIAKAAVDEFLKNRQSEKLPSRARRNRSDSRKFY